jgi:hypothetical protein
LPSRNEEDVDVERLEVARIGQVVGAQQVAGGGTNAIGHRLRIPDRRLRGFEPVASGSRLAMATPTRQIDTGMLGIYMNDQLAAGVIWREVARRSAGSNEGTPLGEAVERVAKQIAEDVATFERIMDRLGIGRSRVKASLAVVAERAGRLKLNGRLFGYSPLSRFVELDFLAAGIEGKRILWGNLRDFADLATRLPDVDFDHLIERAERQRAELEPFRAQAGREAFLS